MTLAGAAALPTQLAAATTPYRAALTHRRLRLSDGAVTLPRGLREPVVLVALRQALTDQHVVVHAELDGAPWATCTFTAFSDVDTWLPLGVPPEPGDPGAAAGALALDVLHLTGEAALAGEPARPADRRGDEDAGALVEVVVVEGMLARVLLLGEVEKQRLRRDARAIAAGRELRFATRSLLDRYGADRGVARIPAEADRDYRARLATTAQKVAATPARLAELLDGPGTGVASGLPSLVGVRSRFEITEGSQDVQLGVALVMVGPTGVPDPRADATLALARLHADLDEHRLVPVGGTIPAARVLPPEERARLDLLAGRLGAALDPSGASARVWLAPQTAQCLDLALRTLAALGSAARPQLIAGHDPSRGSRFALGLVLALKPPTAATWAAAATAAEDRRRDRPGIDADVAAVIAGLQPRPPTDDPAGTWLWRACGLRTALVEEGELLLSPLPVGRLDVVVPAVAAVGDQLTGSATMRSLRGTGRDARVDDALGELAGASARHAVGDLSAHVLDPTAAETSLAARAGAGATDALPAAFSPLVPPLGLVAGQQAAALAGQLLEGELPETLVLALPRTHLDDVVAGGAPEDTAARWAAALGDCGFVSVRGLWDGAGDRLLLVAGLTRMLGPGTGAARPSAYRWRAAAASRFAQGSPVEVVGTTRGPHVGLVARQTGPALVVVVVPLRTGAADPYQVIVTLPGGPGGPQLDLEQYGYVMNLLEEVCPIGVEISTYDLRRNHVDVDADGRADFLTSSASRTYLRYRRRHATLAALDDPTAPHLKETDHG